MILVSNKVSNTYLMISEIIMIIIMILDSNKVSNTYLMISEITLLFRRFGIETLSRRALNHQEFWSLLKMFRCQAFSPEEFPSVICDVILLQEDKIFFPKMQSH